jgi:hypothetical protein
VDVVSPELALVDPELRRADIERLAQQHASFALAQSPSLLVEASAAPPPTLDPGLRLIAIPTLADVATPSSVATRSWPRRIAQLGLLAGLLASGILVAIVATRDRAADRPVLLSGSVLDVSTPSTAKGTGTLADDGAALSRELLVLVVRTPSRLPSAFIDPRTGLAKDLQAVCNQASSGGYLCVVRLAHRPGEVLYVRYGPNGFKW